MNDAIGKRRNKKVRAGNSISFYKVLSPAEQEELYE